MECLDKNWWENYVILRNIFSFLCVKNLDKVSLVCDKWKDVAIETKKYRQHTETFLVTKGSGYNILPIWGEARWVFIFGTKGYSQLQERVLQYTTPDCMKMCLTTEEIEGTLHDLTHIIPTELKPSLICLRLPKFLNFGIEVFEWNEEMDLEHSFELPDNCVVKCLLTFTNGEDTSSLNRQRNNFVALLQKRQVERFVVGGCFTGDDGPHFNKHIVFYGSSVESYTTVVTNLVPDTIEDQIKQFKSRIPIYSCNNYTKVLFVFRSSNRRTNRVSKKKLKNLKYETLIVNNPEIDSIEDCFPMTPTIGCRSSREIVFNSEINVETDSELSRTKRKREDLDALQRLNYYCSTSLVCLIIKKQA